MSEAAKNLLNVNNIEVVYDHVILVLKGVSLDVPDGGIVALLGANGAGKTTTLKAISNLLKAERGEVTKGNIAYDGASVMTFDWTQMLTFPSLPDGTYEFDNGWFALRPALSPLGTSNTIFVVGESGDLYP